MRRPEWDFDTTTTVESNRRKPVFEEGCPYCKHVHRDKGAGILRCYTPILIDGGPRFKRCMCDGRPPAAQLDPKDVVWGGVDNGGLWKTHAYLKGVNPSLCGRGMLCDGDRMYPPNAVKWQCCFCAGLVRRREMPLHLRDRRRP